jgi:flagellar hook protein FlgE
MISSLYAGISGLAASATAMGVVGDNIANVNTHGFKGNRSLFGNILNQSLTLGGVAGGEIGRGVRMLGTSSLWTQGSLENTANPTDLAVNGRGFFILTDEFGSDYYTRAGAFNFDKEGQLVSPDSKLVQGWDLQSSSSYVGGPTTDIVIPGGQISEPTQTTEMTVEMNLDSDSVFGDSYTTAVTVYDSLGNDIPVTLTFTRTATNNVWTVAPSIPASAGSGATINGNAQIDVTFDTDGNLVSVDAPASTTDPVLALTLTNGAGNMSINWDMFNDVTSVSNGDISQFASTSSTTFVSQNGYSAGTLQNVSVDAEGVITGVYTNGEIVPLYQIALADFPSYQGLEKKGENLYRESVSSGQALPGVPGSGRLGRINSAALEMSNVDLATEFVKMITTQRAFSANSKVITTSDDILHELINIKR